MEGVFGLRLGSKQAHTVHETWFRAVGAKKSRSYILFTSERFYTLGAFNQVLGFIHSFFLPRAKVYVMTGVGCTIAALLKKKIYGAKIISINSDTFFTDLNKAKGIRKGYMLWLLKHVDGLISTSSMMKKLAEKYVSVPHQVVYPFCDVKKFSKIKCNYDSKDVCSIATARYSKGADIMKKVFLLYKQKFPGATLYVLGKGDASGLLRQEKDIVNPDWGDPVQYLPKCSVYLNTSRTEPFGVNIIEAMCSGLPTIVSKHCGAAEIVRKVDPWLITSLDPKEIAGKLISLQKKKKIALGKKGKGIAQPFTKEKSVKEFTTAFALVIKK